MRAQPLRELGQIPDFAQMHTQLEQAMFMQGHGLMLSGKRARRQELNRVVVGDQRHRATAQDRRTGQAAHLIEHLI